MSSMSSKLVIVTGASGGIGRATALEFARDGADLILQYHSNRVAAERVAREINSLGHEVLLAQVNLVAECCVTVQDRNCALRSGKYGST